MQNTKWNRIPPALCIIVCFVLMVFPALAQNTISTQGVLTDSDGVPPASGLYNMQFNLFESSSGGTSLWKEVHDTANKVEITRGHYTVELGSINAFPDNIFSEYSALWLEVAVDTSGNGVTLTGDTLVLCYCCNYFLRFINNLEDLNVCLRNLVCFEECFTQPGD